MEKMKPYMVLMMDLNEAERQCLISSLPRDQQRLLLGPGLIQTLPEVCPRFVPPQRNYMSFDVYPSYLTKS
jgi:hypothetical protein